MRCSSIGVHNGLVLLFVMFLSRTGCAVDFERDVLPILSDRCFVCHGPDAGSNDSGVRLDIESHAKAALPSGSGAAIVPGDIDASVLIARIISSDASSVMPPRESKLELSVGEIDVLRRWIQAGAPYKGHWAFELLPTEVTIPQVELGRWASNEIDSFVAAKLQEQGLSHAPEAPRWQWLRRVTFDLTGLPPTLEELDAFESDRSRDAYEKVVNRLLESSNFGEHFAVAWLDSARYADSYGYQSDQLNTQWPYRDWVVRALNENLPYDDFLTWQLAGDLLPDATQDQILATAFNRLHRLTNEGGAVFEEWKTENVADRVHTFGTAMLGLTLECSRCHDHKYDPISMRDYYSIFAFFNSIDENGLYDRSEKVPSPTMLLPTDGQREQLALAKQLVRDAEQRLGETISDKSRALRTWSDDERRIESKWLPGMRVALDFGELDPKAFSSVYYDSVDAGAVAPLNPRVQVIDSPLPRMQPYVGENKAVRLDGERGITLRSVEKFDRWTPFSVALTFFETTRVNDRVVLVHHSQGTDAGYNGWDLTINDGFLESRLYRVWPGNSIGVRTKDKVLAEQWLQVTATYDGSSDASGLAIFLNGQRLDVEVLRNDLLKSANVGEAHGGKLMIGHRFRSRGLADGLVDDFRYFNRELTTPEIRALATTESVEHTAESFVKVYDEEVAELNRELYELRRNMVMAEEAIAEIPIMKEMNPTQPAFILARGQYDAPKTEDKRVTRDTFENLPPKFPKDAPRDRLGLAIWLTDPNHPLTSRVAVNRLWQNFFGTGLVLTPENFGRQGDVPEYRELLDWLARDFVNSGWDVKQVCRKIVLSSTYRQSSRAYKESVELDKSNEFLSRGPAYRLSAEQIRDSALFASGLLNRSIGGAPVFPYQPGGDLWRESNEMSPAYRQSSGADLYRRSLYSVWKRTAPLPNMMTFDASSREVCVVSRARTSTPLQALVLLNDPQYVEASRVLAAHLLDSSNEISPAIATAFFTLTSRRPEEVEHKELTRLYNEELAYFQTHPDQTKEFLAVGQLRVEHDDPARIAALATVCQAILSLDAAIWKR